MTMIPGFLKMFIFGACFLVVAPACSDSPTKTEEEEPGVPTLSSPSDEATDIDVPVTLAWNPVNGASSYQVQLVGASGSFDTPDFDDETANIDIKVSGLNPFTEYMWRVRALAGGNQSKWSEVRTFTTSMEEDENLETVDTAINNFMQKHNIPGLALAVVKNEKLVYAKGYGKADTETGKDVTNNSLFRIASLSKPITAVAVMKLVETEMLSLNAKVFGEQGVLGSKYGSKPYSAALEEITVEHLLMHTSGSWPNNNTDPMFRQTAMNVSELIDWVLDNYTVSANPGSHYAYSNFGYALLGRVIEEVTGMSYEAYVKQDLLDPVGAAGMQIAGNTEADRKNGEVKYYGQGNQTSFVYNMNVERMDAHGGWLASAVDLARFLVRVDGFNSKEDLIDSETIQEMTTPSSQNPNYAKGWSVNSNNNWWHTGSLPGTGTFMVRASNGYSWVILTNTRTENANQYFSDMDALIWNILNDSSNPTQWPDVDLF